MMHKLRLLFFVLLVGGLVVGVGGAAHGQMAPTAPTSSSANAGWEEIGVGSASGGGISDNNGASWSPSLAVSPDGPIIAWDDDSDGDWEIYVRRWDGAVWVEMGSGSASGGGISDNAGTSENPSLVVSPDGPIIAWEDNSSGDYEIYVRRWDGAAWVEMGAGSAAAGGISQNVGGSTSPSVVISSHGPIVAWQDWSNDIYLEIYVRRWDGVAWVEMGAGSAAAGGISDNSGFSYAPSLAAGPDGALLVVWVDESEGVPDIYGRRWNGAAWVEIGSGSAAGGGISNSNVALQPSLAVGPEGMPIVAWEDGSSPGGSDIYVRRWDGAAWVEMGAGSAAGGGISANGLSWNPSLAVSADGPIVAWEDGSSGEEEIYVKRWDGAAWVEMGAGSAAGGGISDSSRKPWLPALAVAPDGPIVAWNDNSSGDHEIYVRRSPQARAFIPAILNQPPPSCFVGPDEVEPNNTQLQANGPLCPGQTYHGRPNDSYDVFYFDTAAAGPIDIELNDFAIAGGQLGLLSADFAPIDYDVTPGDGFHISRANEPAGRYYVVVHAAAPNGGAGAYGLRATFATR